MTTAEPDTTVTAGSHQASEPNLNPQEQLALSLLSPDQQRALLERLASEPTPAELLGMQFLNACAQARTLRERLAQFGLSLSNPTLRQNAPGQPINLTEPAGAAVFTLRPAANLRPEHLRQLSRQRAEPLTGSSTSQREELVLTGQGLHHALTWKEERMQIRGLLSLLERAGNHHEEISVQLPVSSETLSQLSSPHQVPGPEACQAFAELAAALNVPCPDAFAALRAASRMLTDQQIREMEIQ